MKFDLVVALVLILYIIVDYLLVKYRVKSPSQHYVEKLNRILLRFQSAIKSEGNFRGPEIENVEEKLYHREFIQSEGNFVTVKRDGSWKKILKPLLVKGDIIKLSIGEEAPTKLKALTQEYQLFQGQKFSFQNEGNSLNTSSLKQGSDRLARKGQKECIFRVQETLFLQTLGHILNFESGNANKIRTNYDTIMSSVSRVVKIMLICFVSFPLVAVLIWSFLSSNLDYPALQFLRQPVFQFIFALRITFNLMLRIINGWNQGDMVFSMQKVSNQDFNNIMIQKGEVKSKKITYQKSDQFYENMKTPSLPSCKRIYLGCKFIKRGVSIERNYAVILAHTTSNAKIILEFCFIDHEGIITENTKYVDEMALLGKDSSKIVLDLLHNPNRYKDQDCYSFENQNVVTQKTNLIKPLALAMSLTPNPFYLDRAHLQNISELSPPEVKQAPNFADLPKASLVPFQECFCGISQTIGYQAKMLNNYHSIQSFWERRSLQNKPQDVEEAKKNLSGGSGANQSEMDKRDAYSEMHSNNEDEKQDSVKEITSAKSLEFHERKMLSKPNKSNRKLRISKINADATIMGNIVKDEKSLKLQLFCRGEVRTILSECNHYFNGSEIIKLTEVDRHNILSILKQWDFAYLDAVGFSYRPLLNIKERDLNSQRDQLSKKKLLSGCIFLGMLCLKYHPKNEVKRIFQKFGKIGARCVLFSREGNPETITLGNELGLETEWNSIISLSSEPDQEYLERNKFGRIVMPFGIQGVRDRLKQNEDVPLLVNMFCDATSDTIKGMVEIYREEGEVVVTIGSAINFCNIQIFQRSDLAFALQMRPISHCLRCLGRTDKKNVKITPYQHLGMELISLPCDFLFRPNLNIFCFYALLRKARELTTASKRAITFFSMALMCLWVPSILDMILALPSSLPSYGYLYILFLMLPALNISFLFARESNRSMSARISTLKISQYLKTEKKFICYSVVKLILTSLFLVLINYSSVISDLAWIHSKHPDLYHQVFHSEDPYTVFFKSSLFAKLMQASQSYSTINEKIQQGSAVRLGAWLIMLSVLSAGFRDNHSSSCRRTGFNVCLLTVILFNLVVGLILMGVFEIMNISSQSWLVGLLLFIWIFLILMLEEIFKMRLRNVHRVYDQQMMKMFYVTKLGLHSPE